MESRPDIKLKLTPSDKVMEVAGRLFILLLWSVAIYGYSKLPETVPIHFDGAGKPDGFGGKATIFLLPAIGSVLFTVLTLLNTKYSSFNYPVKISAENALQQYTLATKLMRVLKTLVLALFLFLEVATCFTATGQMNGLGPWFLPVFIVVMISVLGYFIVKMMKGR